MAPPLRLVLVMVATSYAYGFTLDWSSRCLVNQGQPCSHANTDVALSLPNGSAQHLDSDELMDLGHFALSVTHPLFINPGIVVVNGSRWGVMRIQLQNGSWAVCPNNSVYTTVACPIPKIQMISFNIIVKLNSHLRPESPLRALDYDLDFRGVVKFKEMFFGVEDPRIFTWGDDVYIAYNGPPAALTWRKRGEKRMKMQRLFPSVLDPVDLVIPQPNLKEKNWAPIGPNDNNDEEFLFARFIDPHEILSCRRDGACQTVATTNHTLYFNYTMFMYNVSAVHLATNAVRLNSMHYGAIFHGKKAHSITRREYIQLPYIFEAFPPYDIVWVASKPLVLPTPFDESNFIYACGLTRMDEKLVISYNAGDRSSSFYVSTLKDVFGNSTLI